jgi:glycosyltransferase involved in cell wall biosynthesis
LKIAFESQLLLKGNKTGIGWCADNWIRGMAGDPEYECQLNFFSGGVEKEKLDSLEEYRRLGIRLNPNGILKAAWYKLIWPFVPVPYHWFFGSDCQITQFFNYVIPPGVKGKKVTIVYDMSHLACRDTVRLKTKKWLDLVLAKSCKRADIIVTISEFSKQEIMKYMHIPEEKIRIAAPGVNLELFHNRYDTADIEKAKAKYGIAERYILYTGTIEPRKNLERLIQAYDRLVLQAGDKELPQLVLAGGKGWLYDNIYKAAEKPELRGKVLFTGYVDEADSPLLMSGAEYFCFPSVYEGFGMPPVEAMACGTPVMAAYAASLPEVLGEHAVYVDPLSVEDIAQTMKRLLEDDDLRARLRIEGPEHVKKYDWSNSLESLRKIYAELLEEQKSCRNI